MIIKCLLLRKYSKVKLFLKDQRESCKPVFNKNKIVLLLPLYLSRSSLCKTIYRTRSRTRNSFNIGADLQMYRLQAESNRYICFTKRKIDTKNCANVP